MICTASNSVTSFERVERKWVSETSNVCIAPMVLTLTKKDITPQLEEADVKHVTE